MFKRPLVKVLAVATAALTVSVASAQNVYAPTGFGSSPVMPGGGITAVSAPQWGNTGGGIGGAVMPAGPSVMPQANMWSAAPMANVALVPGPLVPGQNPFVMQQQYAVPQPAPGNPAVTQTSPYPFAATNASVPAAPVQQPPAQIFGNPQQQAPAANNAVQTPYTLAPAPAPAMQAAPQPPSGADGQFNPFATPAPARAAVSPGRAAPFSLDMANPQGGGQPVVDQGAQQIDISALRYYASKRDLQRVGAEMRRLKALYPDWEPPADLFAPQSNVDEQPLWDLFAAGQYASIRAKIAAYKSVNPEWTPSDDLMQKLEDGEARVSLERAFLASNWNQVVAIAGARPTLLVCNQMQSLWNVGEALGRMRDYARSFELYKYILTNCASREERLATVQKASLVLPEQGTQALVMMGEIMPDGTSEFENVGFNPLREKMGLIASGDSMVPPVSDSELQRFAEFVQRTRSADDAGLFGWYYYAQEQWEASNAWFTAANYVKKDPKLMEGLILSLRKTKHSKEALDLARKNRKLTPELNKQYIEVVSEALTDEDSDLKLSKDELSDFEDIVRDAESALGAQAIGWHYIAEKELGEAEEWFQESVEWEDNEGAVIGLAVAAARQRHFRTLASIRAKYGDKYAALSKFGR